MIDDKLGLHLRYRLIRFRFVPSFRALVGRIQLTVHRQKLMVHGQKLMVHRQKLKVHRRIFNIKLLLLGD